ncbi:Response regulator receiver domain-containing protein [Aeromonas sp. RU39B]|uniref:response regulator n=1 Tax=Aeromonas sp. RU39B TaxID=1907416 RepID=UPI0009565ABB|nr:alpha/beta hydrolase [Aeromonas sp. RU39B]SIQ70142.1 Response regulator receiver domain-containing protein [Aeromonas sp. RU39B]
MRILIVDDDNSRALKIKSKLFEKGLCSNNNIDIANNVQSAHGFISSKKYNILILDVVLPKRDDVASAKNGLEFLTSIASRSHSKNIKRKLHMPDTIIGITANTDDISLYRKEFESYCFHIIEASIYDGEWMQKLINAVQYKLTASISNTCNIKKIVCITIHGIRTTGKWQIQLQEKIKFHTDDVAFETYKYGFFSVLLFLLAPFRWREVNRFRNSIETILRENPDKEVYIFCHSFGTYVAVKTLERLSKDEAKNIKLLVLAGSVLKQSYDFTNLLKLSDIKIVNDCGTNDIPLLFSELFVLGAGMAGRVGFKGSNNDRFTNRFFPGGHSHYFNEKNRFIDEYWLPFFETGDAPEMIDQRSTDGWSNWISAIVGIIGGLKAIYIPAIIITALIVAIYP